MSPKLYLPLLGLSFLAAAAGIITLIPASGASWENVLGYRSYCTFTPASTFFCFAVAGTSCIIRAGLVKRRAIFGKPMVRLVPVVIVSAILLLGAASTVWYFTVDSRYADVSTSATLAE